jgi:predicted lipid-binding transport protein (Tim44 family)
MRMFLQGFLGLTLALAATALVVTDAEAKRMGGGRTVGAQRNVTNAPPAQTPGKPAQQTQQAAPGQTAGAAPAGAAQPAPASGFARWAPMLGGLALGGMLGYLMGANGMGGLMVGIMLALLLGFGVFMLVRFFAHKRGEAPQRMQYAGMGNETVAAPPPSQAAGFDAARAAPAQAALNVPADFNVASFLHGAKLNYMKLQLANDRGNLDELREFTTPELFEELKKDIVGRSGASQQTDVMSLNADLLEVATEGGNHWASVRFSGQVREGAANLPEGFEEVWNLAKPADGSTGWVLAGIQQMH